MKTKLTKCLKDRELKRAIGGTRTLLLPNGKDFPGSLNAELELLIKAETFPNFPMSA